MVSLDSILFTHTVLTGYSSRVPYFEIMTNPTICHRMKKKNTTEFMYKFHSRRLTFVSDTFFTQVNKRHNYKYKKRQQ